MLLLMIEARSVARSTGSPAAPQRKFTRWQAFLWPSPAVPQPSPLACSLPLPARERCEIARAHSHTSNKGRQTEDLEMLNFLPAVAERPISRRWLAAAAGGASGPH